MIEMRWNWIFCRYEHFLLLYTMRVRLWSLRSPIVPYRWKVLRRASLGSFVLLLWLLSLIMSRVWWWSRRIATWTSRVEVQRQCRLCSFVPLSWTICVIHEELSLILESEACHWNVTWKLLKQPNMVSSYDCRHSSSSLVILSGTLSVTYVTELLEEECLASQIWVHMFDLLECFLSNHNSYYINKH